MPNWRDRALCAQTDPELFFGGKGGDHSAAAKRICAKCSVVDVCLTEQLAWERTRPDNHPYGYFGGVSAYGRRKLLRDTK